MARAQPPGTTVLEGDEVVASKWRRRWRAARRRVQAAFLVGVVALPVTIRAAGTEDFWGPVAGFAVLVAGFTVVHLWAGARMWMRPLQVTDEGVVATQVSLFVAPRRFVRWAEIADARVEPWGRYGDRVVFKLRGGRALHTIPGELDGAALAELMEAFGKARGGQGVGGVPGADP